jgi:hypothetical protein
MHPRLFANVGVVKSNHMERTKFFGQNEAEERNSYRQAVRMLPVSQTPADVSARGLS